ncbi:MAG: hypothetical protein ABSD64_06715 [Terriglobales bacterium]
MTAIKSVFWTVAALAGFMTAAPYDWPAIAGRFSEVLCPVAEKKSSTAPAIVES